jgi:quinol monooxygenase YgiN
MEQLQLELPTFMQEPIQIGEEISITGKWVPKTKGGIFRKSPDSGDMIKEWEDIHKDAREHDGMLSTEINHAIGQDAVLVHHIFKNERALGEYFSKVAGEHVEALHKVAQPDYHLLRAMSISDETRNALQAKGVNGTFGEYLFGFVKHDYKQPDPSKAVQVTAKWTCKPGESIEELKHWWLKVGTDAYSEEEGMIRFEAYKVIGEDALIIHETFDSSDELKFHLTKGMAARYKNDIDQIAAPENYFFRGPVSWTIRTYSKFMGLPATYSSRGSHWMQEQGTMSEGLTNQKIDINMENQQVMVVYSWTAKEGKSEELKSIYAEVTDQMKSNEPGALRVQCYFDESTSRLIVQDVFQDAGAVGFHLGTTAAGHFGNLMAIANPGEFLFCGDVPEEMKAAATGMGLQATFAPAVFSFKRN